MCAAGRITRRGASMPIGIGDSDNDEDDQQSTSAFQDHINHHSAELDDSDFDNEGVEQDNISMTASNAVSANIHDEEDEVDKEDSAASDSEMEDDEDDIVEIISDVDDDMDEDEDIEEAGDDDEDDQKEELEFQDDDNDEDENGEEVLHESFVSEEDEDVRSDEGYDRPTEDDDLDTRDMDGTDVSASASDDESRSHDNFAHPQKDRKGVKEMQKRPLASAVDQHACKLEQSLALAGNISQMEGMEEYSLSQVESSSTRLSPDVTSPKILRLTLPPLPTTSAEPAVNFQPAATLDSHSISTCSTFPSSSSKLYIHSDSRPIHSVPLTRRVVLSRLTDLSQVNPDKSARKWQWKEFKPRPKSDFKLFRWGKSEESDISRYVKFNRQIELPSYTDVDYRNHLIESSWSKRETDYLWDLCRTYDLRFIVIHDRYDVKYRRSIEDLKARAYFVLQKLFALRASQGQKSVPDLSHFDFSKEKEVRRKALLREYSERWKSPDNVDELLTLEYYNIKEHFSDMDFDRRILLEKFQNDKKGKWLSGGSLSSTPLAIYTKPVSTQAAPQFNGVETFLRTSLPSKRNRPAPPKQRPGGPSSTSSNLPPVSVNEDHRTKSIALADALKNVIPVKRARNRNDEKSQLSTTFRPWKEPPLIPGPTLRSLSLAPVKSHLVADMEPLMQKLGIDTPTLPTEQVVNDFDDLRRSLYNFLEYKRISERLRIENKELLKRKIILEGGDPSTVIDDEPSPAASVDTKRKKKADHRSDKRRR